MPEVDTTYKKLVVDIGSTLSKARENALRAINQELVKANWEIGRQIVEFEQHGNEKAEYGSALLTGYQKTSKFLMVKALEKVIYTFAGSFI